MQLVVVMAVRNAVSAATITFTANSIIFFFMFFLIFNSVLGVFISPPELGGVRGGLNKGTVLCLSCH